MPFWENIDDYTVRQIALFTPNIFESLDRICGRLYYEYSKKRASELGFENVDKYLADCFDKNPIYPARQYLECLNEYGAGSTKCNRHKERWLELKVAQKGNKVSWTEKDVDKMLKEDAIEADYVEGYFYKKDPSYLKVVECAYEECIAENGVGAENTLCKFRKQLWLEAKAFQNDFTEFIESSGMGPKEMPDVLRRVLKIKFDQLSKALKEEFSFGNLNSFVVSIKSVEFEIRGLLYGHILLFLNYIDQARITHVDTKQGNY